MKLLTKRNPNERNVIRTKLMKYIIQNYIKNGSIGDLKLTGLPIYKLPNNLIYVNGDLDLRYCPISELPTTLIYIRGDLLINYSRISKLHSSLMINGNLCITGSPIAWLFTYGELKKMCTINGQIK